MSRTATTLVVAALVMLVAAPAAGADGLKVKVRKGPDAVTVGVNGRSGYEVRLDRAPFAITTERHRATVLRTAAGDEGGLRFEAGGSVQRATELRSARWDGTVLHAELATTSAAHRIALDLRPQRDRYALTWSVVGEGEASGLGLQFDLDSAGHWYGHGEASTPAGGPYTDQPWPLDTGAVRDESFGPASYQMIDPFWYTSSAVGLQVDTGSVMDVSINDAADGLGRFTIAEPGTYSATVFVERNPRDVYRDYIGVVGKPAQSDATYEQFEKPMWNSWAQFYTDVDQPSLLEYAEGLHARGLGGHTIQLDDKWESNYGNLTFDASKFPDPRAMSDRIHQMGFDMGLWITLWINLDSTNYQYAVDHGYLLMSKEDASKPCTVTWWNGTAGIVDVANPAAKAWYEGNVRKLMADYGIDGFKFDTRFFDEQCLPAAGLEQKDYQRLGAELADEFDLQGAGIRVHWSGAQQARVRDPPGRQGHRVGLAAGRREAEPGDLHDRLPVRGDRHDRRLAGPAASDQGGAGPLGADRVADAADVLVDVAARRAGGHVRRRDGGALPGGDRAPRAARAVPVGSGPAHAGERRPDHPAALLRLPRGRADIRAR